GRGGLEAGVDLAVVAAAGLGHGEVLGLGRRVAEVGQQEAPPALPRLGVADELLEVRRPRAAAALDGVEDAPSGGLVPVAEAPDAVGPLVVEAFEGADLLQQAEAHAGADGVLVGGLGEHLGVVAEDLPPRAVGAALCGAEEAA